MIQTVSVATALFGTTVAAIWDLKTTEVPDQISYAMIGIALLLFGYQSVVEWNYLPIVNSIIPGLIFLAFGLIMYHLGQWGGADALLLSAVGFLLPGFPNFFQTTLPYPLTFFTNLFIVGAGYMLLYALVFSILNKKIFSSFSKELKASGKMILFASIGLFVMFFIANWYFSKLFLSSSNLFISSITLLALTLSLFIIWKFAKAVEDYGFKKKIPVSKLRIGDMLLDEKKLVGITKDGLIKIKRSGRRHVWIKEGVRFAPSFLLALIFTLLYGDGIFLIMKFMV